MIKFPMDVKLEIASKDPIAWYLLYRYDPEFRIFAQSNRGISMYIDLFMEVKTKLQIMCSLPDVMVTKYKLFGKLNRPGGLPAQSGGYATYWYKNDKYHRDNDLPAVVGMSGAEEWYINGVRHRDGDGPAVIKPDGTREWYKNGILHRDKGPALVSRYYGIKWYTNGLNTRNLCSSTKTGRKICNKYFG